MKLTTVLLIVVALFLVSTSKARKVNNDTVDVAIVIEVVPRYGARGRPFPSENRELVRCMSQVVNTWNFERTRAAVVEIDSKDVTVVASLSDGTTAASVSSALQRVKNVKMAPSMGDDSQLDGRIRSKVFQQSAGDRVHCPNIVIFITVINDLDLLESDWHKERWARSADIVIATTKYAKDSAGTIQMRIFAEALTTPPTETRGINNAFVDVLNNLMRGLLETCPYEETPAQCYFDATGQCLENVKFEIKPPHANLSKYCLTGEATPKECRRQKEECDRRCDEFERQVVWGPCSVTCGVGEKEGKIISDEDPMYYNGCPKLKSLTQSCETPCGSPTNTTGIRKTTRTMKKTTTGNGPGGGGQAQLLLAEQPSDQKSSSYVMQPWLVGLVVALVLFALIISAILIGYFAVVKPRRLRAHRHLHQVSKDNGSCSAYSGKSTFVDSEQDSSVASASTTTATMMVSAAPAKKTSRTPVVKAAAASPAVKAEALSPAVKAKTPILAPGTIKVPILVEWFWPMAMETGVPTLRQDLCLREPAALDSPESQVETMKMLLEGPGKFPGLLEWKYRDVTHFGDYFLYVTVGDDFVGFDSDVKGRMNPYDPQHLGPVGDAIRVALDAIDPN